ncbi:hypothetical protein BGZ46_005441 [Entomortierella lignicola]|nr:hypothetical protein BGZ46_005441 [Entomortierella lignicola]
MSAGIARDSILIAHSSQDMDNVINTNLMGTIWINKAVAKGMMRRKKGFSKSLSKELGSRGVTVNVIAPGYIDTDMTSSISDDKKKDIIARTSLGRFGQPDDVAQAALFLAQAKFITGQVLVVDGGLSL